MSGETLRNHFLTWVEAERFVESFSWIVFKVVSVLLLFRPTLA